MKIYFPQKCMYILDLCYYGYQFIAHFLPRNFTIFEKSVFGPANMIGWSDLAE